MCSLSATSSLASLGVVVLEDGIAASVRGVLGLFEGSQKIFSPTLLFSCQMGRLDNPEELLG
jgi:hypothetical protein